MHQLCLIKSFAKGAGASIRSDIRTGEQIFYGMLSHDHQLILVGKHENNKGTENKIAGEQQQE